MFENFFRNNIDSAAIYDKRHAVDFVSKIRALDKSRSIWCERNHGVELQQWNQNITEIKYEQNTDELDIQFI